MPPQLASILGDSYTNSEHALKELINNSWDAEVTEVRVEALMTTCRALKAEIEQTRTHAAHLLQAVLKEAFAPTPN